MESVEGERPKENDKGGSPSSDAQPNRRRPPGLKLPDAVLRQLLALACRVLFSRAHVSLVLRFRAPACGGRCHRELEPLRPELQLRCGLRARPRARRLLLWRARTAAPARRTGSSLSAATRAAPSCSSFLIPAAWSASTFRSAACRPSMACVFLGLFSPPIP